MSENTATQWQEVVPQKDPIHKPAPQRNPIKHRVAFSKLEISSTIIGTLGLMILTIAIISGQIGLTKAQFDLQKINQQITTTQNSNVNTKQEISSLSSRDRLLEIAKRDGLTMNNSNIRNVTK